MSTVFKIIHKRSDVEKLVEYCKKTGYASVDFETNAKPINSELFEPTIMGVSFQPGSAYIMVLGHFDSPIKDEWLSIFKYFCKEVIENPEITKISWNLKFEYTIYLKYGIKMQGRLFDGMLAKYLLDENTWNGLKENVGKFLPQFKGYEDGASKEFKNMDWDKKPLQELSQYCAKDCDYTFRLMVFFERKLIDLGFYPLFRNMLMMGTRVLAEAEYRGMFINMDYLDELEENYRNRLEELKVLMRTRKVVKFEKWLHKQNIDKLLDKITKEITQLNSDLENETEEKKIRSIKKKIQNREDKLNKYIARDFSNKKEMALLEPVNLASDKQLVQLLFTSRKGYRYPIVKYVVDKKNKKITENPSTDGDAMVELLKRDKDGLIKHIIEFKKISKLYSTYIKGFQSRITIDDCIHGRFLLHGTVTGRLSSRDPNLQNIPRDTTAKEIKKMFVPPPGMLIMQLDYSQAELRVMAAQAGETTMIEWFHTGKDIHLATACKKHRWDYDQRVKIMEDESHPLFKETKVARKQAKTINFGIIYGQGPKALSESLSEPEKGEYVTIDEAQIVLEEWFADFPLMKKHIDKQHKFVKQHGYVKNVFGRKRRLPEIYLPLKTVDQRKKNWGKVAEAQRASVNAPIQGAASDYTLFSSIIIWEYVQQGKLPKSLVQVATVHDSIIYYVDPKDIHKIVPTLSAICENPQTKKYFNFQIDAVKMKVDFEIGVTWADLKSYKPNEDYTLLTN